MYKAFNLENKQDVILLDPYWIEHLDSLRALDNREALVCPGCLQPVRIRAGRTRRWHFAHKHLENCPFEQSSPDMLAARAMLYGWLVVKFGPEAVMIEKALPEAGLPRPVDCCVEWDGQRFAYWIITHRLAPDLRERLKQSSDRSGVQVNWVLHVNLLRPQQYHPNRLHLTTTEREFIQVTPFDEPHQDTCSEAAGSLHYLDPEREALTTYRGLCRVHAPQLFRGQPHRTRLDELLVSLQSGEFVHPGEQGLIEQHRREQMEYKTVLDQMRTTLSQAASAIQWPNDHSSFKQETHIPPNLPSRGQAQLEVGRCIFCGQETSDWWYFNRATAECKCRACYRVGRA